MLVVMLWRRSQDTSWAGHEHALLVAAGTASQLAVLNCPTGGTADAFPGGHYRAATRDRSRNVTTRA
jgi:hypothetical protein